MDKETLKVKTTLLYILLIGSLIFSQNLTWKLLLLIPNISEYIFIKSYSLYQTGAGVIYIFTAIFATSDLEILHSYLNKHPLLTSFLDKAIYIIIRTFGYVSTAPLFFVALLDNNDEIVDKQIAEIKESINSITKEFYSPILEVRLFSGALCFMFLLLIVSLPLPEYVITIMADIVSLSAGVLSCMFVLHNARQQLHTIVPSNNPTSIS